MLRSATTKIIAANALTGDGASDGAVPSGSPDGHVAPPPPLWPIAPAVAKRELLELRPRSESIYGAQDTGKQSRGLSAASFVGGLAAGLWGEERKEGIALLTKRANSAVGLTLSKGALPNSVAVDEVATDAAITELVAGDDHIVAINGEPCSEPPKLVLKKLWELGGVVELDICRGVTRIISSRNSTIGRMMAFRPPPQASDMTKMTSPADAVNSWLAVRATKAPDGAIPVQRVRAYS